MRAPAATIRVANAPCSWGVLEFDDATLAAADSAPSARQRSEQVLSEMAAAGYAGTELGDWGFLPSDPAALGALLGRHQLSLVGAFVPVALADERAHAAGVATALRTARLLAAVSPSALVVLADDNGSVAQRVQHAGRIRAGHGLSDDRWRCLARGAEQIARAVAEQTGLRTVFHHHCAGYVETPDEVARLLDRTDPRLLGLCLDTGHYRYGGGSPTEALARHGDRIWHVHLKDSQPEVAARARSGGWDYFRAVREGIFCELGAGEIDFGAVLAALEARGYRGWVVVEQDVLPGAGTPLSSARRSRAHLRSLGL